MGALLVEEGFILLHDDDMEYADHHVLAWAAMLSPNEERGTHSAWADADAEQLNALRDEARDNLKRFKGRDRQIKGQTYLHFGDYRAWAHRKVGDVDIETEAGFILASWNDWIAANGGNGVAPTGRGQSLERGTTFRPVGLSRLSNARAGSN